MKSANLVPIFKQLEIEYISKDIAYHGHKLFLTVDDRFGVIVPSFFKTHIIKLIWDAKVIDLFFKRLAIEIQKHSTLFELKNNVNKILLFKIHRVASDLEYEHIFLFISKFSHHATVVPEHEFNSYLNKIR